MNSFLRCVCVWLLLGAGFAKIQAALINTNEPDGFRLTVELQDGSKVIGKSRDDSFQFRSETLGKIDLPLQKIRSVEALTEPNLVKLTTTSADALTVEFSTKSIRLETAFGDVKLPVGVIKSVRVVAFGKIGRPMDGLVGFWQGEGNGVDSAGGNNGMLQNVSFVDGVAGKAFSFSPNSFPYGTYAGVQVPDKPAYALTHSLTIEGWVRPRGDGYVIFCRGDRRPGMDPFALSMQANHDLRFQICDDNNNTAVIGANIPYYEWTHIAAILDDSANVIKLYTNGVLAAQMQTTIRPIGGLIPGMSPGVGIGNVNDGGNDFPFIGDIDEITLYNRALTTDEINAIYNEYSANASNQADPLPTRNPSIPTRFGRPYFPPASN